MGTAQWSSVFPRERLNYVKGVRGSRGMGGLDVKFDDIADIGRVAAVLTRDTERTGDIGVDPPPSPRRPASVRADYSEVFLLCHPVA